MRVRVYIPIHGRFFRINYDVILSSVFMSNYACQNMGQKLLTQQSKKTNPKIYFFCRNFFAEPFFFFYENTKMLITSPKINIF